MHGFVISRSAVQVRSSAPRTTTKGFLVSTSTNCRKLSTYVRASRRVTENLEDVPAALEPSARALGKEMLSLLGSNKILREALVP